MENTLLLNMDDILHFTTISGNIDQYKMNPHIFNAQILYIEPILGSDLYEKIISLVNSNGITATTYSNYNTLLFNYITPSLVFHTLELYIPLNAFQIADGGTFQYSPTNAQPNTLQDIDRITKKYQVIGSKYDDKLTDYLVANKTLFIEYYTNTGLVKKTETTNRSGWYLGTNNTASKIRI